MYRMRALGILATLLATVLLSSGEDPDCPITCSCETGTSGVAAKCSALYPSQRFELEVTSLDLSNIPKSAELELSDRIFSKAGLKRVSSIKIVNSVIKRIDIGAFQGLHNLYSLNLTGNHIELLQPDTFVNNTHLERLSLSQNPLQNMQVDPSPYTEYFLSAPSLEELDLSACGLSHLLPTIFKKLTTLIYINLADNELTEIPNGIFEQLVDLEEVNLANNKIKFLTPELFQHNTELTILTLKNNPLSTLAGVSVPNLQKLDISQCDFQNIDSQSFAGFTQLRNLNLSGNSITTIPADTFKQLKKLLYLDLSNNNLIGEIPDDLFLYNHEIETIKLQNNPEMKTLPENGFQGQFSELYLMDISNCGITHLSENAFQGMNHISFLNLSSNELQYIKPGTLSQKIMQLDLSYNKIFHMDEVSFRPNSWVRKLFLSGNPLKKISPNDFINVPRLTKLYLKSCDLKQLWDLSEGSQTDLKSLTYLNIAQNMISSLTVKDLSYIQKVQTLVISNNPLVCNDDLKKAVKQLVDNGVASSDATERKQLEEMELSDDIDLGKEHIDWQSVMRDVCKENEKFQVDPFYNPYYDSATEEEQEATEIMYSGEPNIDTWGTDTWEFTEVISNGPEDEIQKELVYNTKSNYMWPIIIVSLSAFTIILGLVALAAFLLRWNRQKNSYRNRNIRRHSFSTSRLRRGANTVYQQLYEETSTPPTPIMSSKQVSDIKQTYTFPEKSSQDVYNTTTQPNTNASYRIGPFHHSNIIPESV